MEKLLIPNYGSEKYRVSAHKRKHNIDLWILNASRQCWQNVFHCFHLCLLPVVTHSMTSKNMSFYNPPKISLILQGNTENLASYIKAINSSRTQETIDFKVYVFITNL